MATVVRIGRRWRAQVRKTGVKSISKTFDTKAEAAAWARDIEQEIDRGEFSRVRGVTLRAVIQRYRETRAEGDRPILATSNTHYMLACLDRWLGDRRVEDLEVEHLVQFARDRRREGTGPYTVNMEVGCLGTVLRHMGAVMKLRVPDVVGQSRPVLAHMGLIGGGAKRTRRPQGDELARIVKWLGEQPSPTMQRMPDLIVLAALIGLRRGEVCRALWADLDERERILLVRDRKHPRQRVGHDAKVPLIAGALDIIKRQPRDDERIFPLHPQTVSKYFKEACNACGVPDLRLHDLRHEAASALIEAGWSPQEAKVVTGHIKGEHFDRYVNLDPAKIARKPVRKPRR